MSGDFGGLSVDSDARPELPQSAQPDDELPTPAEPDTTFDNYGNHQYELPGQGEKGAGCDERFPQSVCQTCGHIEIGHRSCGARSCPDCWGRWARDAAVRGAKRIQAFRHTQPDDHHRQVVHAFVSPPEGAVKTKRQYWDGRTKAAEIAKEKGFRGFTVVPHPYRLNDHGKLRYAAEDPDYGKWVWLRNDVEEMNQYIEWSPHYHIIGVTTEDMDPADESDKWSYTFKRSLAPYKDPCDRKSHKDLYGCFRYILSHTGYPEGCTKQIITWYGDLANSVFVENADNDWQHQKPDERIRDRIEREIEAVVDDGLEDDRDDEREHKHDDEGDCPVDECAGFLIHVFDVGQYLRQEEPPPDVRERMVVARDWRMNRIQPPPGMKQPTTEDEAREALEELL